MYLIHLHIAQILFNSSFIHLFFMLLNFLRCINLKKIFNVYLQNLESFLSSAHWSSGGSVGERVEEGEVAKL